MLAVFFIINWGVIFPLKIIESINTCRQKCHEMKYDNSEEAHYKRAMKKVWTERKKQREAAREKSPRFPNKKRLEEIEEEFKNIVVKRYVPPKRVTQFPEQADFSKILEISN